jgi:microsomal dipeptidase-like Zn-dependent dipeptidase
VTEALLAEGHSDQDIAAIMGGNAVRVLMGSLPAV